MIPIGDDRDEQLLRAGPPRPRSAATCSSPGRCVGVFKTPFEAGDERSTWTLSGEHRDGGRGLAEPCTATLEVRKVVRPPTTRASSSSRSTTPSSPPAATGRRPGPLVVGTGEGTVERDRRPGTSLADYDSRVECTRNGAVAVSVPGHEGRRRGRPRRHRRLHVHEHAEGTPPPSRRQPPHTAATTATPPPAARCRRLRPARAAARPRRHEDGRADDVSVGGRITWTMTVTNRSSVAAADVNGLKLDDPRSFRDAADLADGLAGHVPPVHLQSRAPRPRRVRNRRRGDRGVPVGWSSTSSGSARRSPSRTTATTSPPPSRGSSGPSRRRLPAVCSTLTAAPRAPPEPAGRRSFASRPGTGSAGRSPASPFALAGRA